MTTYSLVMASRNRRLELGVALPTMVRQRPGEIVFVDDGSTDGTEPFVRAGVGRIPLNYARIEGSAYKRNPSSVWNRAVALAKHETVVLCCPECASVGDPFALLAEAASDSVIAVARTYNVPIREASSPRPLVELRGSNWEDSSPTPPYLLAAAKHATTGLDVYCGEERPVPYLFCGAVKKSVWNRIGGYDEKLKRGADYQFGRTGYRNGIRFVGVGDAVVLHIAHDRK